MSASFVAALLLASPLIQSDRLYTGGASTMISLDSSTGEIVAGPTVLAGAKQFNKLTYDGARLIALDQTLPSTEDNLLRFHPANGSVDLIGPTTQNWTGADVAIAFDPATQKTYAFNGQDAYDVDPQTGALSYIGFLSGLPQFHCVCSVAFLPDGSAYAVNFGFAQSTLYKLDMTSLHATTIGTLQTVGPHLFLDLAIDSAGQLWCAYSGDQVNPRGFYTIDTTNLTIQFQFSSTYSSTIAFGPSNDEVSYCQAKPNSIGCVPDLVPQGLASPTASSGYVVSATNVRNRTMGRLIYSVNGPASLPFAGGTLCVSAPWKGTSIVTSGGAAKPVQDCSGTWSYDLNAHFTNKPGPQAGDTVHCQWIGRDRGFAPPDNYALTAGLEFTMVP